MANIPPKKPVNDLIKFWVEKQEQEKGKEKKQEPISRSPRRPLSPNTSSPPSPRNDNFPSDSIIRDIPSGSPSTKPSTKQSNNVHSEGNANSIIDIQTLSKRNEQGRMDWSSLPQSDSSNEEISSPFLTLRTIPPVPAKNSYIARPRDHNINTKDASSK